MQQVHARGMPETISGWTIDFPKRPHEKLKLEKTEPGLASHMGDVTHHPLLGVVNPPHLGNSQSEQKKKNQSDDQGLTEVQIFSFNSMDLTKILH